MVMQMGVSWEMCNGRSYLTVEEVEEFLVGEDVKSISRLRINHRQTMNLMLNQHLDCII